MGRDFLAGDQRGVVLLAEQGNRVKQAPHIGVGHSGALRLRAGAILQNHGHRTHHERVIGRICESKIHDGGRAVFVEGSRAHFEDTAFHFDVRAALYVEDTGDERRDYDDADAHANDQ